MINELQREKIRKEAREILEGFAQSLEDVKLKGKELKRQSGGYRKEAEGTEAGEDFRKIMFANAPQAKGDCLIAEKKKWL